ncbi:uncharacterized protein LOC143032845 [Oratosquilla oratoria]|uniref:uncharacterized protein LOC143032845 n=1 Tax=Oratosquilla oratoria TaxID=337810 RepID=UPI003F76E88F
MKAMIVAFAVLAFVGAVAAHLPIESKLSQHLSEFTIVRDYLSHTSQMAVKNAREYIKKEFDSYHFHIYENKFNTTITTNTMGKTQTVEGVNIIGVTRGMNERSGPILLVAADYDSASKPLQNNGIGISALLEVARQYYENTIPSANFEKNLTVMFVALDFNTRERILGSSGKSGAQHFISDWLMPHIDNDTSRFGGAIVLDSIGNFNPNNETQHSSQTLEDAFPETYERVINQGSKGNFMALLTMNDSVSQNLKSHLTAAYYRDRMGRRFRLEDMTLGSDVSYGKDLLDLVESSSQFHFWTNPGNPLPAILLTDTGTQRKDLYQCTVGCLVKSYLTPERKEFVEKTIDAIVHTLIELQTYERPPSPSSTVVVGPSVIATVVLALVARWL